MSSEVQEQSANYTLADLKPVLEKASGNNTLLDSLPIWLSAQTAKSAGRGRSAENTLQYGVQKLRELILELAVRGKLVPQDLNDEPASVLLEKIAEEKARLIKEGKIKKQKKLPAVHKNEEPYTLPSAWSWAYLGHVTNYGITDKAEPNSTDEDCWVLELEDIEKGSSKLLQKVLKSDRQFKSSKNKFSAGDVLYGKLRPYLDKVLVANDDGVCTTEIIPFKGYAKINSAYIRLVMKSPRFMAYANDSTHGMNLPRLGTDNARLALIPLPPIAEQHRIVKKVDQLMALCDKLEQQQADAVQAHDSLVRVLLDTLTQSDNADDFQQNWRRIAEHFDTLFTTESSIDQLKQTLLQLAVMGKLVPQNPNDEPARVLLEKVTEEKARLIKEGKIKKQKSQAEITEEETPFELPNSWKWVRFAQIAYKITDGAHHTPTYVDAGVPFLSVKDMSSGKLIFDDTRFISHSEHEELFKRCDPEKGDLLLTKVGTTGIPVLIRTDKVFSIFVSVALVKFNQTYISGDYLEWLISSPLIKEQSDAGTEGVGNKNLVLRKIANFVLPIPPLAEQHRIVKKVDELMALCDQLKNRLNKTQILQQQLADAVVEQTISL